MTELVKQIIESIGKLPLDERALVAHHLISSLELKPEDNIDGSWSELAKSRYLELESGK